MLSVSARLHVLFLSPAISLCACVQADRFHQACDAIVNTVVLIRVKENNFIFGGFTGDAAWSSKREWVRSSNSFVFSLVNAVGGPVRLRCTRPEYAIGCYSSCGPAFGRGCDIDIHGDWTRAGGECLCNPHSRELTGVLSISGCVGKLADKLVANEDPRNVARESLSKLGRFRAVQL